MRKLRKEIWEALHTRETWIMIAIVATVTLTLGIITGALL